MFLNTLGNFLSQSKTRNYRRLAITLLALASPLSVLAARTCTPAEQAKILSAPTKTDYMAKVTCTPDFPAGKKATITRQLVFEGAESSNVIFDCKNVVKIAPDKNLMATTGDPDRNESVVVRSISPKNTSISTFDSWPRPTNVRVVNCSIEGAVRIYGLGVNGEAKRVVESSKTATHTANAQAKAPRDITFQNVSILASGRNPFYVGPGASKIKLTDSSIKGSSNGVAVYLDAESTENDITFNTFDLKTNNREIIAVDGSSRNWIAYNEFKQPETGGIFIYRNCGEGGGVRHQKPTHNDIRINKFYYASTPTKDGIYLGQRGGNNDPTGGKNYCELDAGYPWGSSISNLDFADNNTVYQNTFIGPGSTHFKNNPNKFPYAVRNRGNNNDLYNNAIAPSDKLSW